MQNKSHTMSRKNVPLPHDRVFSYQYIALCEKLIFSVSGFYSVKIMFMAVYIVENP
jgi:hypothetical protein